jgi:hypothetical protein
LAYQLLRPSESRIVSPTDVIVRRADLRAGDEREGAGTPLTRRAVTHRRSAHRRRLRRLRRTILVALTALVFGTVVARFTQDPSVAFPRPAASAHAEADTLAATAPLDTPAAPLGTDSAPAARPLAEPTSGARDPVATGVAGELEEGASDPAPSAGATATSVQRSAAGTVQPLPIPSVPLRTDGRPIRFTVEAEDGLNVDTTDFAKTVASVLTDERGWQGVDSVHFVPISPEDATAGATVDIRVTLATPDLTAKLCAPLDTSVQQVSCWNNGRAVLNLQRWILGAATYGNDLASYRDYLVNHEVGHGLGHMHAKCPATGQKAPIMVQQTKSLEGCTAWPWPSK